MFLVYFYYIPSNIYYLKLLFYVLLYIYLLSNLFLINRCCLISEINSSLTLYVRKIIHRLIFNIDTKLFKNQPLKFSHTSECIKPKFLNKKKHANMNGQQRGIFLTQRAKLKYNDPDQSYNIHANSLCIFTNNTVK